MRKLGCLLMVCLTASCRDLDRFDTAPGEAYCGSIAEAPFSRGFGDGTGAEPLGVRLTLDVAQLTSAPGAITSNDAASGACAPRRLFDEAQLRPIGELQHDPLSTLEFGEGRDYNFFAWVDSSCQSTMVAVVSLMQNGTVELRLLRPAQTAEGEGFGLFSLERHPEGCGF